MSITSNLKEVQKQINRGVELVAVSKTKPLEALEEAYAAGQRVFGENRIQEMAEKWEVLPKDIEWHMIGHVQDNKIKYMAGFVSMVHGMDKEKRLKSLDKEAAKHNRTIDCLIQIHIAQEESKFGFDYHEARQLFTSDLEQRFPNLRVRGLMGMATFTQNKDQVRAEFKGLKNFFDELKSLRYPVEHFDTLSMGMSGDFKIAQEEGSTMVRVGSSIFGARA